MSLATTEVYGSLLATWVSHPAMGQAFPLMARIARKIIVHVISSLDGSTAKLALLLS